MRWKGPWIILCDHRKVLHHLFGSTWPCIVIRLKPKLWAPKPWPSPTLGRVLDYKYSRRRYTIGFYLEFSFPSRNWIVHYNCGDKSFYSDPGPLFLISSTVSISPLKPSSRTLYWYSRHSYLQFQIACFTFLLVFFDSFAGKSFLARSIKLWLVDNQRSSGVTVVGFESCLIWSRIANVEISTNQTYRLPLRRSACTHKSISRICRLSLRWCS
jgi:hypothetical protein